MINRRWTYILLLFVPVVLWLTLAIGRFGDRAAIARLKSQLKPKIDAWNRHEFTRIEPTPAFRQKLDSFTITQTNSALSELQLTEIRDSLYCFLLAYNLGTLEAFRAFRTPAPEFKLESSLLEFMAKDSAKSSAIPSQPSDQLDFYWTSYIKDRFVGLWTGVAIDSMTLDIQSATSEILDLHEYIASKDHAGIASAGPILTPGVDPADLLRSVGVVTYATASMIVQSSEVAYPVYCRYFWRPDIRRWVPIDMRIAYSGPRRTTPLF